MTLPTWMFIVTELYCFGCGILIGYKLALRKLTGAPPKEGG